MDMIISSQPARKKLPDPGQYVAALRQALDSAWAGRDPQAALAEQAHILGDLFLDVVMKGMGGRGERIALRVALRAQRQCRQALSLSAQCGKKNRKNQKYLQNEMKEIQ